MRETCALLKPRSCAMGIAWNLDLKVFLTCPQSTGLVRRIWELSDTTWQAALGEIFGTASGQFAQFPSRGQYWRSGTLAKQYGSLVSSMSSAKKGGFRTCCRRASSEYRLELSLSVCMSATQPFVEENEQRA